MFMVGDITTGRTRRGDPLRVAVAAGAGLAAVAACLDPPGPAHAAVQAAPPPAFVVAAARREAAALGDPNPASARYVLTRRRAAVEASSGASVVANQPVYLIVLRGRFKTGPVGPSPGRIVTGRYATEILSAATGRDTDFSVGPRPVPIGRLGDVGDLLPYMQGHARPACAAPDVRAAVSFQGATGSELGSLTLVSRTTLACTLPSPAVVALSWRAKPLAVKTISFPPGWLSRMNPRWGRRVPVLEPGARSQVILQWFNWCGAMPWRNGRGFHLTVALRVPRQAAAIAATTRDLVTAPYCNLTPRPHSGTASTLRVSPFVEAS